ncbi:MAG: YihY/virulence factor BrkB family protein [Actinobacteria bacterium]|nr:YihY/virulence factor BrkB family protein [Actinomycetota bacterium]MBV8958428.1 YihY/virulence factor BrkB family protein [Actinomycetota bacterium]MBV9254662.1 YihY/virulence factor BrkB family protein [Actinomycetota bacterium]MBV9664205.1 YihY/virulence factor BrkB family protein [Actinomycetota bacterium]MBV9936377.1 YihY/virulence factor BrkB family protein [Actinomycetota bacterium]
MRNRPPQPSPDDSGRSTRPSAASRRGDRFARLPVLRTVVSVQKRYSELRGNNVAAAVTFQAFVSLFPLLLVIVAVVGLVAAHSHVDVAGKIIGNLGLKGDAATTVRRAVATASRSKAVAGPIGLLGLLWSGLGLVNALQYALNQAWQVEERGIKDKAVGMAWLAGAAVLFVGASAVTAILNWLPGFAAPAGVVVGLAVNFALWLWTFTVLPNTKVGWRSHVIGAACGAVGMEVLKLVGAFYVPRAVAHSSQLYGTFGIVFAVMAWLLFFGRLILYSAIVNVVHHERKVGTVRAVVEVPAQPGVEPTDAVTRSGRVERAELKAG